MIGSEVGSDVVIKMHGEHFTPKLRACVIHNRDVTKKIKRGIALPVVHAGTLMLTVWILFVSVGILLARHYKNVWEPKMICAVKPWFAVGTLSWSFISAYAKANVSANCDQAQRMKT